ncbi:MAG: hypothetical protein B6U97_00690 [Candidatus Altiarchaeales archaeon ex4484_96]|nr:MAG: hypothetical protein B6U97_00690 [Candidatus Altiarchaeales archaeon ex4484_96]
MFKPVSMKKVRLGVLDRYVEDVMRELSKMGVVHILDIKDTKIEVEQEPMDSEQCTELLRRINHVIDLLGITEEHDAFGELKIIEDKIAVTEKSSTEQLSGVADKFQKIEAKTLAANDKLIELSAREEEIKGDIERLRVLKAVDLKADWVGASGMLVTLSGLLAPEYRSKLVAKLDEAFGKEYIFHASKQNIGGLIPSVVSTLIENTDKLDELISGIDFRPVALKGYVGDPVRAIDELNTELDDIKKEKEKLTAGLRSRSEQYRIDLLVMRELVLIEKNIDDAENLLGKTKRVYVLQGWVPERSIQDILRRIRKITDENVFIRVENPKEDDRVPTFLDNPSVFKPFEVITSTFGLPSYNELDPTPVLALTFPFIYGLMFGDVGHGFMVGLIGLILFSMASKGTRDLGFVLTVSGLSAMVFGVLYGDFFGLHGIIHPVWTSPLEAPTTLLLFIFGVGMVHIGLGLFMDVVKLLAKGELLHALFEPITKLWLYYGTVAFGLMSFQSYGMDVISWVGNMAFLPLIVLPLVVLAFSGVLVHLPRIDVSKIGAQLAEGGFEAFDTVLIFLSNTLSYGRMFALLLVHAGLFVALFSVVGTFTGINHHNLVLGEMVSVEGIIWFVFIFIGTFLIIGLEGLIVFLHTLRLHYYEWFTKFFDAEGNKYQPFTIKRIYTLIGR